MKNNEAHSYLHTFGRCFVALRGGVGRLIIFASSLLFCRSLCLGFECLWGKTACYCLWVVPGVLLASGGHGQGQCQRKMGR